MDESRKRPESEESGEIVGKRPRIPAVFDDEEDLLPGFSIGEDTLTEVMKMLEEEISCPSNVKPSTPARSSPPSSAFVTINGNEESCGSSFSDSASTVMANIDMGSINISYLMEPREKFSCACMSSPATTENFPWVSEDQGREWCLPEVGESSVSGEGVGSCGDGESDDEWLARVLSGAPFEFDE